jgi:hypothetical protein
MMISRLDRYISIFKDSFLSKNYLNLISVYIRRLCVAQVYLIIDILL